MTPAEAAATLRAARAERRTLVRFSDSDPALDEAWGHAVQDLDRAARIADGEAVVGAKLGLTSLPKQRTMGVKQPIVGFLTDAMAVGAFDLTSLAQPRVEPEVAFVLAVDLDRPVTRDEVPDLVASVHVALEVLDSRWEGYRFGLADVLADNTSAAGFVLGPASPLPTDLADRLARFSVDGAVVAETTPAAILGDPLAAVVHLAEHLAARGESLPAGSVVLAGAMADAVPVSGHRHFRITIEGLGTAALDA